MACAAKGRVIGVSQWHTRMVKHEYMYRNEDVLSDAPSGSEQRHLVASHWGGRTCGPGSGGHGCLPRSNLESGGLNGSNSLESCIARDSCWLATGR